MNRSEWESRLQQWVLGPGKAEAERCENAERIITQSLSDAGVLEKYDIQVFTQGSFANRTNIPQESDVDICVRSMRVFMPDYPNGLTHEAFGNSASDIQYATYKDDLERALRARFGSDVKRGDKCFTLRENSYRVDADVTATWEHRRYDNAKCWDYFSGPWFHTDSGKDIVNWPSQHIANGIRKHEDTKQQFKKVVRMLKRLQFDMVDSGVIQKKLVASYAIECSVFNLTEAALRSHSSRYDQLGGAVALIYQATKDEASCKDWVEVNGLKWLFRAVQPWTFEQVNRLMLAAWRHVGFE